MINKVVMIFCCLMGFFTKGKAQEIEKLNQHELIYGRIKAVTEIQNSNGRINIIHRKITKEFYGNEGLFNSYIYDTEKRGTERFFDDKYITPTKDQDTTGLLQVDAFSATTGDKIGEEYLLKNQKKYCENRFEDENYHDYAMKFHIFDSNDRLVFKQDYNYNKSDLLASIITYPIHGEATIKVTYKYIAFDSKKNWIKRIEYISKNRVLISSTTTIRKITYY